MCVNETHLGPIGLKISCNVCVCVRAVVSIIVHAIWNGEIPYESKTIALKSVRENGKENKQRRLKPIT